MSADNNKYDNKKDYYERRKGTIIQGGIILLIIGGIIYGGYINNEINEKVSEFIIKWENRIKISNMVNNQTQGKIVDGVEEIKYEVKEGFSNLSAHRIITNATFDEIQKQQNLTSKLISSFNNTNENERGKAVDSILEKVDSLAKALNVTLPDNNETETAIATLEKQIEQLRNNTS